MARCVGPDRVFHLRTQGDIGKIAKSAGGVLLVFVHAGRLHNPLSWIVQMHFQVTDMKPLIVCQGMPEELDESPGPVLVLRGSHQQADVVLRRLMRRQPEAWGCLDEDLPDEDSLEVSRADELLERFDQTGDGRYLTLAESIFSDEEPDLRRFPMIQRFIGTLIAPLWSRKSLTVVVAQCSRSGSTSESSMPIPRWVESFRRSPATSVVDSMID